MIEAFEKAYPNVNVELANVGTGTDEYTALQNAIQAGSGIPDVVHMEYSAVPQFALTEDLADLTPFGAADLKDSYTPGTWGSVAINDGVYGLPLDSGPMAMFYNATVFEENGIAVPETWDEYVAAARTLHAADPSKYLVGDAGDAGFVQSMIWRPPVPERGDRRHSRPRGQRVGQVRRDVAADARRGLGGTCRDVVRRVVQGAR
jgi:multiple sugar transport system substrate-binding protein